MAAATRARSSCAASCSARAPRQRLTHLVPLPLQALQRGRGPSGLARRGPRGARRRPTARPASPRRRPWRRRGRPSSRRARSPPPPCGAGPRRARTPSPRRRPGPRRKPVAENRSPWRVTTTADGWASATSRASAHGPATTTACWSSRSSRRVDRRVDGANVVADAARRASTAAGAEGGAGRGEDAAAYVDLVEVVEGAPRRPGVGDDHRGERLAERGLDRGLPAGIDLDQVEQRAERAVDVAQVLGAGPGAGGVERQGEGIGPGAPLRVPFGRGRARAAPRPRRSSAPRCVRLVPRFELRSGAAPRPPRPPRTGPRGLGGLVEPACRSPSAASAASARASRSSSAWWALRRSVELAPHLGRGPAARVVSGRPAVPSSALVRPDRSSSASAARGGRLLVRLQGGDVRLQGGLRLGHRRQLGPQSGRLGLEAGGDARVHQLHPVALEAAPALVEHGGEAAGPLPQLLDAHEQVAEVGRAAGAQAGLGRQDLRVQPGQVPPHGLVLLAQVPLLDGQALQPPLQRRRSPARRRGPAARSARRPPRRGGGRPRPGAPAGAAGGAPRAAGPGPAAGWPPWRRAGARPAPCACGT